MKKHVCIEIDIDTEEYGDSYCRTNWDRDCMSIVVRKDPNLSPLSILMHELGHAIAHMFLFSSHMVVQPGVSIFTLALYSPEKLMKLEADAWNVAEAMLKRDRVTALKYYEEGIEKVRVKAVVATQGR